MTQNTRHGLWAVVFDNDPTSTDVLGGITMLRLNTGSQVRNEARSGEIYARHQSLVAQKPVGVFGTSALAAALTLCGLTGLDIDGLSNGLHFYAQAGADGGGRLGATSHRKYVVKDGIVVPTRLTCEHQGDAVLEYQALMTYDGSNDPITWTDDQSLPAGITDAERFTLGPTSIESEALDHITRVSLEFGITATAEGADSDLWDTIVYIQEAQPVLRIRGKDPLWLKSDVFPLLGKEVTHANTDVYFRKRDVGGTFVADVTAEHILMSCAGYATIETVLDAQGNATGESELVVPCVYDGTNAPLTFNTASAIT